MSSEKKEEILIISAENTKGQYWQDLWIYRELFNVLAWRDISVRYKQTVLGFGWALVRPFLTMIIFTVVFNKIAKLPSEGVAPYALMVYAGLLPWQFFSSALTESSNSIVGNANLIGKIYFPRLIIPVASMMVCLVDFLIGFLMLVGLMVWYQYSPGWEILTLPVFILMAVLASIGPGLLITSLNVKYRDFRYVIPFIIQIGLYVSPVGFSASAIPEEWRLIYSLNPMVGVIDGFRWAILGSESKIYFPGFLISCVVIVIITVMGLRNFRKMERDFSDLL